MASCEDSTIRFALDQSKRLPFHPKEETKMNPRTVQDAEIAAWVGLDWADKEHALCLEVSGSSSRESSILQQTPQALHAWVAQLRARFGGRTVAIALEQSRGAVIYALMRYDFLLLYPIPPLSLASYRKSFASSGAKTDPSDAALLLELIRLHRDRFHAWVPDDTATRTLQLLVEYRRRCVDGRTHLIERITSLLKTYYPQALEWAGELDHAAASDFLEQWPSLPALQQASAKQLQPHYGKGGRAKPGLAAWMREIRAARTLTDDPAVVLPSQLMVQTAVAQVRLLNASIAQFEQHIQALFHQHPDRALFEGLPGAGPALAPRLLAAFGTDRERFQQAQQIQQLSGIAPVTEQSGKTRYVHWRIGCPRFMRQTFHEFATHSIARCSWARAYYQLQRDRGKQHHAAVRALAYKWMRILFRCWKDRVPYDETLYLSSLERHGSPLHALLTRSTSIKACA
jgi:transposase